MEILGQEFKYIQGHVSLRALSSETAMTWLCIRSGVGRAAFLWEPPQMKPLHMPMVEPEKSDIGFWPGVRSVYVNDSRDRTLGN